jgi:putative MATE family efflux protein
VNVVVGISLVIGWGPFPKLGWDGLAIGTAAGYVVSMLVVVWRLRRGRTGLDIRFKHLKFDSDLANRLLRIGLPGGADLLLLVLCQLWYVSIINVLGNVAAGAHGVGTSIEAAGFLTASAFQVAVATMAGQYLGAGDPRKAGRAVLWACLVGGGIVCANGFVLYFAAEPLAQFFAERQPEVAETVAPLLRIIASNQPFLALAIILAGALRGSGDTRWPLLFTFIGFLLVRIPLAYLLALPGFTIGGLNWHITGFNLGIQGAWYAMWIDVFVRCILMSVRFFHGGWKRVKV